MASVVSDQDRMGAPSKGKFMAKILKYVLGLDGANRFDSFFSVGAPAQGFQRYSAVDNRDNHVTDNSTANCSWLVTVKSRGLPKRVAL